MEPSERTRRSRELRREATPAEIVLWRRLRNRQPGDWKWRRQQPVGPYFADFACKEARLILELDGSQHSDPDGREYDAERTAYLEAAGWRVLRFSNRDVFQGIDGVLEAILFALEVPHPNPLPAREREPVDHPSAGDIAPNRYGWRHISPKSVKRNRQLE